MKLYVIFLNEYGEKIGTKASLYNRINRLETGKPKKRNDSTECIEWANIVDPSDSFEKNVGAVTDYILFNRVPVIKWI